MEFTTELSLASSRKFDSSETSSESGTNNNNVNPKKRKTRTTTTTTTMMSPDSCKYSSNKSNDLHHVMMNNNRRPLPLDWEQCLDLHSGMMYYMNRKTSRKSWNLPNYKDDDDDHDDDRSDANYLDLELNMSNNYSNSSRVKTTKLLVAEEGRTVSNDKDKDEGCNNTVALACSNCHLLVILSKSSPSCPNCKYIHALNPTLVHSPRAKNDLISGDHSYNNGGTRVQRHPPHKSINSTLSLLN